MHETTFAPQDRARIPRPPGPSPAESGSPIYDRLVREWRRAGRTVPRPTGPDGWKWADDQDWFGRA
ncbi:hypothetical protein [Streptomyces sp. NPDC048269]|uniref:hypothetical protein n=1 Tax=Streptomyces sp. NPDC048269 TaxID=3155753 RepID=UPI0034335B81